MSRGGRPPSTDSTTTPTGRGRTAAIAATALVLALLIGLLVWQPWSEDGSEGASGHDATSTTVPGQSTVPNGTPTEGSTAEQPTPADDVPIGTVPTDRPGGACAAVIERLVQYRDAAKASSPSELQPLFEKLSEFEDNVFSFAQGQEWGDRVVEQLVVVRRLWSDAGSADGRGEDATAEKAAHDAMAKLDALIDEPPCPEG